MRSLLVGRMKEGRMSESVGRATNLYAKHTGIKEIGESNEGRNNKERRLHGRTDETSRWLYDGFRPEEQRAKDTKLEIERGVQFDTKRSA
jgi:hypothetical protein